MTYTSDIVQMILAIAVILYYLFIFFVWGTNLTRICKVKQENKIAHTLIAGFLLYYLVFECVALPMKIRGVSVTSLSWIWLAVVGVLTLLSIFIHRRYMIKMLAEWGKFFEDRVKYIGTFWGMTLLLFMLMVTVTPVTMGVQDDSYYIADVTTSIVTDTIQQYDYSLGSLQSSFYPMYFIPMYPMHGAVIYKLTLLHPIIENKWCCVFIALLLSNLIYAQLSLKVCKGNEKKSTQLLVLLMFFRFNYILWGKAASTFFFFRISEGKGILANIILPALLLFFWEAMEKEKRFGWLVVELVILSAFSISMSSMFLVSVSLGCLMVSGFAVKRDFKLVLPYAACTVPCIGLVIVYEALIRGIIALPIM